MKVFLSWSGNLSHQVALVLRDWLPSVIQSIEPYVSSEDIDKGARWSTDIAKELENSTYGILCVTKENVHAPWLTFEAGALSKTIEKSYVSPFLFDIKRSEVNGPILQFQSTILEKEDIKKLTQSLNRACGSDMLSDERLERAFNVWYPTLENQLKALLDAHPESDSHTEEDEAIDSSSEILEEILDLTRNNQRLLRNPEGEIAKDFESIKSTLAKISEQIDYAREIRRLNRRGRINPIIFDELIESSGKRSNPTIGFQIAISLLKQDYPWLHDSGSDLARILKSKLSPIKKQNSAVEFFELLDFTFDHPLMREMYSTDKEHRFFGKEISRALRHSVDRILAMDFV